MSKPWITIPGGRPKHIKQLQTGSPTANSDCGPSTILVGLESSSKNEIRPWNKGVKRWIADIRRPMYPVRGIWPATTPLNAEQSVESRLIRDKFRARGLRPPTIRWEVMTHNEVAEQLRQGKFILIGIDYDRLNKLMPWFSGSPTFRGGHAVGLRGWKWARKVGWSLLYDPLHDGRRDGIPKGIQTVRLKRYLRAGETWGTPKPGKGRARVAIIR